MAAKKKPQPEPAKFARCFECGVTELVCRLMARPGEKGATLIAARNLGRKVIGVEREEKYCELIAERFAQQVIDFGALL